MNGVANLSLVQKSHIGDIAFIDLKAQQKKIRSRIEGRLGDILDHGRYIAGPEIEDFEQRLAQWTGAAGAVACGSGTAALIVPLLAQGLEAGDAVFLPAFTYNATANAVLLTGATPVFVDVDPNTFNMDPDDLERRLALLRKTGALNPRAIIPVDIFGSPADYPKIAEIAERENLFLLADGAQSFGGAIGEQSVGNLAPVTAMSFFPGKALGAYGDAGAILTQDEATLETWRSIRWHGTDDMRKNSVRVGFNGRMDSFQAAVLLEKLSIADEELEARCRIAAYYDQRLAGFCRPQTHLRDARSGYNYYSVRVENRDIIGQQLKIRGVPTAIYYTTPLHKMPAFAPYAPEDGLPVTEAICQDILSLPMHPYLTPDQMAYICDCFEACVSE